jgi:hypothetical protein
MQNNTQHDSAIGESINGQATPDLHGVFKRSLSQTDGLERDADAPFVQQFDGDLVTVANASEHRIGLHNAVCETNFARAAGANAELVLVATNAQTRVCGFNDECGDALVPEGACDKAK